MVIVIRGLPTQIIATLIHLNVEILIVQILLLYITRALTNFVQIILILVQVQDATNNHVL
jgi:hypothetical protein